MESDLFRRVLSTSRLFLQKHPACINCLQSGVGGCGYYLFRFGMGSQEGKDLGVQH